MLLFWLQRASIRCTRLLGRLFCTALLSCSWGGKQICLRVGKGGRGRQHLSHGREPSAGKATLPALELHRADKSRPPSSRSSPLRTLSICTDTCTFCQSDNVITTCSIFEVLKYVLHNSLLRWDNAFGWAMERSGLLAPHCSSALGVPGSPSKLLAA